MSKIVRPPKTAGTNEYQKEVAAGATAILDTEVDADFTTIYTLVNGNLDNDNISGSPNRIDYAKLNLTGKIQASDLQSNPPFALPPNVTLPPLTVDKTMMKIGAAWWAFQVSASPGGAITPAEVVLNDFVFQSRGGLAVIIATMNGSFVQTAPALGDFQARLLLDGAQIAIAQSSVGLAGVTFSGNPNFHFPLSTTLIGWNFTLGTEPVGGRHVQLVASFAPNVAVITVSANQTAVYVLEPS